MSIFLNKTLVTPVTPCYGDRNTQNARQQGDLSPLLRCYTFLERYIYIEKAFFIGDLLSIYIGGYPWEP